MPELSIEAQAAAKFHAERTVNGCPVCHVDAYTRCVLEARPEPGFDRRTVDAVAPTLTGDEIVAIAAAINAAPGDQRPSATRSSVGGFVAAFAAASVQAVLELEDCSLGDVIVLESALAKLERGLAS